MAKPFSTSVPVTTRSVRSRGAWNVCVLPWTALLLLVSAWSAPRDPAHAARQAAAAVSVNRTAAFMCFLLCRGKPDALDAASSAGAEVPGSAQTTHVCAAFNRHAVGAELG